MLDENSVYYSDDVDNDPRALLEARKPAVRHHIFARRSNRSVLVLQRLRKRRDQITQALSARRNVRAVLEIVWRPITIVGGGIPPVKTRPRTPRGPALCFSMSPSWTPCAGVTRCVAQHFSSSKFRFCQPDLRFKLISRVFRTREAPWTQRLRSELHDYFESCHGAHAAAFVISFSTLASSSRATFRASSLP